ncbi:hypothetical protein [Paracoccus aminophilus]|uniref:Uncharacterized protein n=1 Tax=Paracoccus aminophilus JCM 7686 TaxID=1367847 RepID=S5XL17_PARAH|nr:hypothetical protein [Paracoccus aminophilus]AGT07909.1 hypothetical protein JCM7686_0800 [Paracoccus aminophilus JCM 7686]
MDLTRNTPPALLAALSGPFFYPVVLVDVDWPGSRIRAHSNAGPITWDSRTFQGVGKFGNVDVPGEAMAGIPEDFRMSLTCDLPELATYADTVIRGRAGSVYLGATASRGGSDLIGAVEIASGTCDGLALRSEVEGDDGQTVILYTLTVTFSTGPSYRSMAAIAHSHEDQIRSYPHDTAGEHLILAQANAEKTLWPAP